MGGSRRSKCCNCVSRAKEALSAPRTLHMVPSPHPPWVWPEHVPCKHKGCVPKRHCETVQASSSGGHTSLRPRNVPLSVSGEAFRPPPFSPAAALIRPVVHHSASSPVLVTCIAARHQRSSPLPYGHSQLQLARTEYSLLYHQPWAA